MGHLIATPFLESQESTVGYMLRLANANGFRGLKAFKLAIADMVSCRDIRLMSLADVAAVSSYEERDFWKHIGSHYLPRRHTYFFRFENNETPSLPREAMNFIAPRICPVCVAENGHISHRWDCGLTVHCHKHNLLLQDRCPTCKKYLTWDRPYLLQCKCGIELSAFSKEDVPKSAAEFHWLMFEYRQGRGSGHARKVWMRGMPRWFAKLSAGQVAMGVLRFTHLGLSRQWQEPDMRADFGLRVIDVVSGISVIMQMLKTDHAFALQALRLKPEDEKYSREIEELEAWRHPERRTYASKRAMTAFQIRNEMDVDN